MGLESDVASNVFLHLETDRGFYSDAGAADDRLSFSFVASRRERRPSPVAHESVVSYTQCPPLRLSLQQSRIGVCIR